MKKLMIISIALAIGLAGCQTRITATKNAEQALPVQKVVTVGGEEQVVTERWQIASGGWEATARSPLWAAEAMDGLKIEVATNGAVRLAIDKYGRDLSTNAVSITKEMFVGSSNVVSAVAKAYATIATGGSAEAASSFAKGIYDIYVKNGGNPDAASVTVADGAVKVSDGVVCTTCTADGTCTTCSE